MIPVYNSLFSFVASLYFLLLRVINISLIIGVLIRNYSMSISRDSDNADSGRSPSAAIAI